MPKPTADPSTGWWSIRIRMTDGKRKKYMLMRQPGWSRGKPMPKKPPAEVVLLARKYEDIDVQIKHGVDITPVRTDDLRAFLSEYQSFHRLDHAENSVRVTANAVRSFLDWCGKEGITNVQQVSVATCERYMHARRKSGISRPTVKTEKTCLSPAWSRAVRSRTLAENPWKLAPIPGKEKATEPEYWSREELDALLAACKGWLRDLVYVAANSGSRITALLHLRWNQVLFDRNVIRFAAKDAGRKYYEFPMHDDLHDTLFRMSATQKGELVFPSTVPGKPRRASTAYVAIRRAVRRAGIPEKGHYNHILRHTFASLALLDGHPLSLVSRWLGHASIMTTMRYAHLQQSESHQRIGLFRLGTPAA